MSVENPGPAPAPSNPPRRTTVLLATVAALALSAGVVGGFVWSGGGQLTNAEPSHVAELTPAATPASAVVPSTAVIPPQAVPGALPTSLADIVEHVQPAVVS